MALVSVRTIAQTNDDASIRTPNQENSFHALGRHWVFYGDDYKIYCRTSLDGLVWSAPALVCSGSGYEFSLWYDDLRNMLHCVYGWQGTVGEPLWYKSGIPQTNGSIQWASPVNVWSSPNGWSADPAICVDSDGYPFIAFLERDTAEYDDVTRCMKGARNDGIWEREWIVEFRREWLEYPYIPNLVPLTNGKIYVAAGRSGAGDKKILGWLWDGTSWGSQEACSASDLNSTTFNQWNIVAIGDDVHIVFSRPNYDLVHIARVFGVGWQPETMVHSAASPSTCPNLTVNSSEIFCSWLEEPGYLYMSRYSQGQWSSPPELLVDESVARLPYERPCGQILSFYEAVNGLIGITYQVKLYPPFDLRYALYQIEAPEVTYTLTITIIGQGTTNPFPGVWEYAAGSVVFVTAIPSGGWQFNHWEGDISSIMNPVDVEVRADMSIVAVFTEIPLLPPTYTLTIETIGQGTINPAPGVWEYEEGTEVTVSAIPAAGWQFDHWEGDATGTDSQIALLINQDLNIIAVFSEIIVPPEQYAVSISIIGQGTTEPAPGSYTVEEGTVLTITAIPNSGWVFYGWQGDITGTANPIEIQVVGNMSIVAVFVEEEAPVIPSWAFPLGIGIVGAVLVAEMRKRG